MLKIDSRIQTDTIAISYDITGKESLGIYHILYDLRLLKEGIFHSVGFE